MFKKLALATVVMGLGLTLAGCSQKASADDSNDDFDHKFNVSTNLMTDRKTKVQYIIVENNNGGFAITPRLDKNGKPYISK